MNIFKEILLIAFLSQALTFNAQTPITSGYVTVASDGDYQNSPQIRSYLSLSGNGFQTTGNDAAQGTALAFLPNRQITGFSYTVQPNPNARGLIKIDGLTCPNGYYANPNSTLSTRLDFAAADFYIPKFYSSQKNVTVVVPFKMTGRVSCFGFNNDNLPPYGTKLFTGTGNARLVFTRFRPTGRAIYLLTAQYEFELSAATGK